MLKLAGMIPKPLSPWQDLPAGLLHWTAPFDQPALLLSLNLGCPGASRTLAPLNDCWLAFNDVGSTLKGFDGAKPRVARWPYQGET